MKLIESKVRARSSLGRSTVPQKLAVEVTALEKGSVRALKEGRKLYLYVEDDGSMKLGGIAKDVDSTVYKVSGNSLFQDVVDATYEVSGLQSYKGCRILPSYIEITRVTGVTDKGAKVTGLLHNAYDPVLGDNFKPEDVVALYDGSYYYTGLSPMAHEIKKLVEEQRQHFHSLMIDASDTDAKKALDETAMLLKPHAYEAFHKQDDLVYFVTRNGKWVAMNLQGNRPLDAVDRNRLRKLMEKEGLSGSDGAERLEQARKSFHKLPLYDRYETKALLPLMQKELEKHKAEDGTALEGLKQEPRFNDIDPIPGLKEGVEFPPHQIYLINKLKDRPRMMVDADPGAGKTVVMIADMLYQMSKDRVKRPLVIVPDEALASQFASEILHFSDLNPWVITTSSVKKWKQGQVDDFLVDAYMAPANTVYITTYNWLSRERDEIDSGHVTYDGGRYDYGKTTVYQRSYKLLHDLGVDAVYIDECQLLRSESHRAMAATVFAKAKQVKLFTGTIMPGNLIDVMGPMGVAHSAVLGTAEEFLEQHSPTKTINSYKDSAPKDIRKTLKEYGVPQVRSTIWASLLPKTHRFYHYVEFNPNQVKAYESLLKNAIDEIEQDPNLKRMFDRFRATLDGDDEVIINPLLLARFTPLEIFLNAPAEASPYLKAVLSGDDAKSPKMGKINEIVGKHLADPSNGKVLIFTQYEEAAKNILNHLDPNLRQQAEFYKGGMVDVLNNFKNPETELKILVGVDKTLRVGQNMQVVNCIIHADTLWVPGDMKQREARAVRIKQQREVYIHHIIVHNSAELLKNARILAQEHLIAKANSDFEDKEVVGQIEMTLSSMKSFRSLDQIDPHIKRQQKIQNFQAEQAEKDKKVFGTRIVRPVQYVPFPKGKKLAVVPSTEDFVGNTNDASYIVEQELDELPDNPNPPTLLKFHLQNWDTHWLLTCFRSSDPQGFVRRMNFHLQTPYMYRELQNKEEVDTVIHDLEAIDIEILNKPALEAKVFRVRSVPGHRGVVRQLEQESKKAVAAAVKHQLEFHFGTIKNFPFVYCDSIRLGSKEAMMLRKVHFKEGLAFWYLPVTRTKLVNFLRRMQHSYPNVKIADWEDFKAQVAKTFNQDLKEFDEMGQEV